MDFLYDGPTDAAATIVLAHGAGAPMDSPFMARVAQGIGAAGIRVARFEFPYMQARRRTGRRPAPDREPVLRVSWQEAIGELGGGPRLVIGGKSLGGRIASMIADEVNAAGLVCLGYPFHAPGQNGRPRVEHLRHLRTPALIVQGARDTFGNREEVASYELSPTIRVVFIEDGDHSLAPRKRSGRTEEQNLQQAIASVIDFIRGNR